MPDELMNNYTAKLKKYKTVTEELKEILFDEAWNEYVASFKFNGDNRWLISEI